MNSRYFMFLSAALLSVSLAACGDDENDPNPNPDPEPVVEENVSGNVSGTWEKNSIINVSGHITVPEGESLTIEEGVTVVFSSNGVGASHTPIEFVVDGDLYCLGTEENPVTAWYIPNAMADAQPAFANGDYLNEMFFEVTEAGQMIEIGVKKDEYIANDWTIFDTWTLMYYGDSSAQSPDGDASGIETPEAAEVVSTTYYTLGGVTSSVPVKGINIVKSVMSDGTVKVSKILVK